MKVLDKEVNEWIKEHNQDDNKKVALRTLIFYKVDWRIYNKGYTDIDVNVIEEPVLEKQYTPRRTMQKLLGEDVDIVEESIAACGIVGVDADCIRAIFKEGLTYRDAAKFLGVKKGKVDSVMRRYMDKIKEYWRNKENAAGNL